MVPNGEEGGRLCSDAVFVSPLCGCSVEELAVGALLGRCGIVDSEGSILSEG